MASALLVRDQNGNAVQALAPNAAQSITGAAGAAVARLALPANVELVRVACLNAMYFRFGLIGDSVDGTYPLMTPGSEVFKVPTGATHLVILQHTTGGAVSVTAMV